MLVMTRRKNESIVIGSDIEVTVIEIRDDKVRLGVLVPRDVPVHRSEVYDAVVREYPDRSVERPSS
jgi:carbon storage regulator